MVTISTAKDISLDDVTGLYGSGEHPIYKDFEQLHHNILNSDVCVTARLSDDLVGIIRSNGDGNNNQYISEIIMHADQPSQGIGSKLLDTYLLETNTVSKIYIVSHEHFRSSFSKTWLHYKGFKLISENEDIIVYLLDRNIKY